MDERSVTLMVPIWNEAEHIDACIRSIRAQEYPEHLLEILVVDGDSTDSTREIVEAHAVHDPRIKLLRNPERQMPYGLNIAIRAARGRYLGVVAGHSVLHPNYVSRAVDALERTGAWCVGGRIVRRAVTPIQRAIALATSSPIGVGDSTHNFARPSGWVETAFPGFWRREVFDMVGLFDPQILVNEDNELSYRIRKSGGRIWYEADLAIDYVPRATFSGLFHQYRRYAIGKVEVFRKHRGGVRWRHFVPGLWVLFLVAGGIGALAMRPWSGLWVAGTAVYASAVAASGIRLSRPGVPWWLVARALITLHAAYGIGTWQGLGYWAMRRARGSIGRAVPLNDDGSPVARGDG